MLILTNSTSSGLLKYPKKKKTIITRIPLIRKLTNYVPIIGFEYRGNTQSHPLVIGILFHIVLHHFRNYYTIEYYQILKSHNNRNIISQLP